ncbi:MAG: long-chain fatty acid--CoA ligase [Candidatus Nitrotoga sp.]
MAINADLISPQQAVTVHGLFKERVKRTPDAIAYRYFDTRQSAWLSYTWGQMAEQVACWQAALQQEKLAAGDRVAIMLRNCPQWIMFDQAAASLGLVVVPVYTVDRADNIAYIVNNATVKLLLFETAEQWQTLFPVLGDMPTVQRFVSLDFIGQNTGKQTKTDPNAEPPDVELRLVSVGTWLPAQAQLQPEITGLQSTQLATIIYTSGTTGRPKGVMLSHANMLENAYATLQLFPIYADDLLLSFLPLSHTFERTLGYYLTVMTGSTVAFARSIALLSEDLQIIQPTVLVSVPRIYERVHAAIHAKLEEAPPLRRNLFEFAVNVGWARFLYQQKRGSWRLSFLLWPLLNMLVAQKVLQRMGGKLRVVISGGAALSLDISRMFVGLGLPVIQGYGLTETSPVICANKLDNNFPDSIGLPLGNLETRIGAQNELLVKGPSIMLGYWNNPEATRRAIDAEGWFHTGDTAVISATGHVYITGRLKDIIVLSNGEKVPPADMELAIMHDRLFDQVLVYGEGRPYLIVMAVVNPAMWLQFSKEVGVRGDMPESLRDTQIEQRALMRIAEQIKEFPGYARVHRVLLSSEPWSIDNGLLTPTLKVKRGQVVARYGAEIAQLYQGH